MDRPDHIFPPDEPVVRTDIRDRVAGTRAAADHHTIDLYDTVDLRELNIHGTDPQVSGQPDCHKPTGDLPALDPLAIDPEAATSPAEPWITSDASRVRVAIVGGTCGRLTGRMLAEVYAQRGDDRYLVSDAGPDSESPIWQTTVAEADRIVVAVDAAGPASAAALATLDEIGATGHADRLRCAVTVILLPPARRGLNRGHEDITALRDAFGTRTADVLFAPYTAHASAAATIAWERVAAAVDRLG